MYTDKIKKLLKRYAGSKYVLTLAVFGAWLIFFDNANIAGWISDLNDVENKRKQKMHYQKEIERMKENIKDLNENDESLEKYARENLYFKNDDEDVYVIEEDEE
ncbi:MAG: septum formation initiator family protein [Prevotellaceae bacterium]|jgi:cell division protein FtsB|nr:septum formation initiator family protein [Prevotellaceae bacterium]